MAHGAARAWECLCCTPAQLHLPGTSRLRRMYGRFVPGQEIHSIPQQPAWTHPWHAVNLLTGHEPPMNLLSSEVPWFTVWAGRHEGGHQGPNTPTRCEGEGVWGLRGLVGLGLRGPARWGEVDLGGVF